MQFPPYSLRRRSRNLALLALAACAISAVRAEDPQITSFEDGRITFADPEGEPGGHYRVEWSSDLAEWLDSWASLSFIPSDGSPITVGVPRFYRVTRQEGSSSIPAAVTNADFRDGGSPDMAKVELGKQLFWDKVLSGNQNISCASCHHALAGTGDGLSLPLGEGGLSVGIVRQTPELGETGAVPERVPRNAPHIFNIGATEFSTMFHDGRVMKNLAHPKGFDTPAGNDLLAGLDNAIAAQAMFPVTSGTEMAGQPGENTIADLTGDLPALWAALADRLEAIPAYVDQFVDVFPDVSSGPDITFAHAANAIGAYEMWAGRADNSPFDDFLRGETDAISAKAQRGMALFYGKAGCATCHSGKFQTDHDFYAIAMPQIGPGKGDGASGREDFGFGRETGDEEDHYKFRTLSLRNVALTGPWGHSGAYNTLEAVVRHHLDPVTNLNSYDQSQAALPSRADLDALDFSVMNDPALRANIAAANQLEPVSLSEPEIDDLMAFLHALTDPASIDLRDTVPMTVPSDLPVGD
ncbi:MAG: cytochrome c peroxidase [Verrucomicrobiales bacterium]|jgi:cytochrome c peroxidase